MCFRIRIPCWFLGHKMKRALVIKNTVKTLKEFTTLFHGAPWRTLQNWANGLAKAARSHQRTLICYACWCFALLHGRQTSSPRARSQNTLDDLFVLHGLRTYPTGPRSPGRVLLRELWLSEFAPALTRVLGRNLCFGPRQGLANSRAELLTEFSLYYRAFKHIFSANLR